jgi:hypothetical protein
MALAFTPRMFAAIDEQLVLNDGAGDIVTIDVSTVGALSVVCTSGSCGNVAAKTTSDGPDGTISVTHATFGNFTISDTAVGWADSTEPTIQDFNEIDAQSSSGGGSLTSTFTDSQEPNVSSELNVADSNTTDTAISASTIIFTVLTSPSNAIPAGSQVYQNSLTGHADSNGLNGANVTNPNPTNPNDVSVTTEALLNFSGTGTIQANVSVSNVAVPEPASIVLLGTLILGLTALIRKKQEKRA